LTDLKNHKPKTTGFYGTQKSIALLNNAPHPAFRIKQGKNDDKNILFKKT
jgi:hypothetical protein